MAISYSDMLVNIIKCTTVKWGTRTLSLACNQAYPGSTMCVQNFDDSRGPAIRITYRISLRSSSLWEPWHPLLKVVHIKYKLGRGGVIQLPVSLNPIFPFVSGFLLYYCMAVVIWVYWYSGYLYINHLCVCVFICYIVTRSPSVTYIHMTPPKRRGHDMNTTVKENLLIHG